MPTGPEPRWNAALRRLRQVLLGDFEAADAIERSRARVRDARDALERSAPRSRSVVQVASRPIIGSGDEGRRYFVLVLDASGMVSTHTILACDDEDATARAQAQADRCAFDVWDGWRFIGRFDPSSL
ncbi:hypothetical protein [Methylobacterium trifolii]|uniref:Uncharacterized protein n=1 Tax=Methylobacterium trifolii TaxID=1003092 RepID=A0ABQ4TXK4_9HYPH|nr:hypothetical protein [Methylobacterium trifolii]GJE58762.1 hypothetical protein MPOCJGCO_0845 [Methylobacterium trifolii]